MMKKKKLISLNSTVIKLFTSIALLSTVIAMLLFFLNFLSVGTIMSDNGNVFPNYPKGILADITDHFSVITDETGKPVSCTLTDESVLPQDFWCILLNENGDTIWSLHKPDDIPDHYSIKDIAVLTRWFLADYPVYVRAEDYGLFILGAPKNSVGKYSLEFSMDWFHALPSRIFRTFLLNFTIAALLSLFFGFFLYQKIKLLTKGLENLRKEESVTLPAKGIFREPFSNINQTSRMLARKNAQLAVRDKARSNWISGISHDIRTPLSMVVGYGGQLAENADLSEGNRKYAAIITAQGLKIKKLIEDLNLISSLEYDMQPIHKTLLQISVVLRSVVGEFLNSNLIDPEVNAETICSPKNAKNVKNAENAGSIGNAENMENAGNTESIGSIGSIGNIGNAGNTENTENTENTGNAENTENSNETVQGQPVYDITLSLQCGQAMVSGDESLLSRAFYNLLQNSITHNENGCLITVSGRVQGESVLLVIADNGQGVPEKVLQNLDTLPNTAHGFGLPMACKIIRAHGGSFHAENKDGFVVTIELPLAL